MRIEENAGEQEKLLEQATLIVKKEANEMKRCLDKNQVMDALKHAVTFLNELKTNDLSPKFYYKLYMDAVGELLHLETFLVDEYQRDKNKILNLYEFVQYVMSIVPRMYLLITIGVVYIKCGEGSRREILADIVEMCRGVQHPLRGLFLRNYLLQSTRSLLPDVAEEDIEKKVIVDENSDPNRDFVETAWTSTENGTVGDAIQFILLNFAEMNKLWVRMQHQGPSREREKRERERMELRILVGTNLVRLSQLENITEELYVNDVLPSILEQVVSCKDFISQEYLMECVIQVFADEFHLATLRDFLNACGELSPDVNVKNVLIALIERLALFAATPEGHGVAEKVALFEIFSEQAKELIRARPTMALENIISLHGSLISLAIKCYRNNLEYASVTLAGLRAIFEEKGINSIKAFGTNMGRELLKLLYIPIDEYKNALEVAKLADFQSLMDVFDYRGRCVTASYIIQNMLDNDTIIETEEELQTICGLLDSLLVNQKDQPVDAEQCEDFEDEQHLVARLIHQIRGKSLDEQFLLLNTTRKTMGTGGKHRIKSTLPPIVFALFKLILQYSNDREEEQWEAKVKKMFMCGMGTIGALMQTAELSELPLKLYLEGAVVADRAKFSENVTVAYEFLSKALSILEDDIADSRDRIRCISLITGSLLEISCLSMDNYVTLSNQVYLAASRLFKKPDQVRAMCSTSILFWSGKADYGESIKNGAKVADILKKAVKISTQCMEPLVQQQLLIHILDTYIFYFRENCEEIEESYIAEIIQKTKENSVQLDVSADADAVEKHFASILYCIKNDDSLKPSLAEALKI